MNDVIINKVAQSGIISLNLEDFLPNEKDIIAFDIKPYLYMELILKEKDFREALKTVDWLQYSNKHIAIYCSTDAIIPIWAYMLVASYLAPIAASAQLNNITEARKQITLDNIKKFNTTSLEDQRVVVKGCGEIPIPDEAYVAISSKLLPVVKTLMYGEPCSTVPLYKKKH
jgi:hypothetical protein